MLYPFIRITRKTVKSITMKNKQKYTIQKRKFSIIPPPNEDNSIWIIFGVGIALTIMKGCNNPPPVEPELS
jgi:hypothetical protein